MYRPEGINVAFMTPFTNEGRIDEQVVREMAEWLVVKGVHGIFPVSTCGEFMHMSIEERKWLMDVTIDQVRGRCAVTPGIGATCPRQSIALARHAKESGADAVVILAPYFFTNTQDIVEKYVEVVADAVDMPIVLYNIPFFTNPILPQTVERLAQRSNIVAIKDSSGNLVNLMNNIDLATSVRPDFHVLIGYEEGLFPALMAGAKGCMTATSGILPEIMLDIYNSYKRGDYQNAYERQRSIIKLIRLMKIPNFPQGFKWGMEARGFRMGPPQQPISEAHAPAAYRAKEEIEAEIHRLLGTIGAAAAPAHAALAGAAPAQPASEQIETLVRQVIAQLRLS